MKKYRIVSKRVYEKDGTPRATWPQVGTLLQFPADQDRGEGFQIELNMFPDTKFFVFDDKPREEGSQETTYKEPSIEAGDVPF